MELYIGPPRDVQVEADDGEPCRPLTRFNSSVQLPVQAISRPSPEVCLVESEEPDQTRPAPVDLDDPQAFYALPHGYSMVPAGIAPTDFCLVSPCAKLEPDQGIWLRDRKGREELRSPIRLTATSYEVAAWQPPKPNDHQYLLPERWERTDVDDRRAVRAVQRDWVAAQARRSGFPTGAPTDSPVCGERCLTSSPSLRPDRRRISMRRHPDSTGGSMTGSSRAWPSAPK